MAHIFLEIITETQPISQNYGISIHLESWLVPFSNVPDLQASWSPNDYVTVRPAGGPVVTWHQGMLDAI